MAGIRLEPLAEHHLVHLEELVRDTDVLRFTRVPVPVPPGFARSWLERYEEGRRDGTREGFAAVGPGGEFLALALAPAIDRTAETAELGYVVAAHARGRGVATETLRLLTEWAFSELGLVRIELLIAAENGASKKVASRCGYAYEGTLRSHYVKAGVRQDTEVWSRLASDDPLP